MRISEMPASERPREKLLKYGREALSTAEVLGIIIGAGIGSKSAVEVAMDLLSDPRGGVGFLAECTPEELMETEGIGQARACSIIAAAELGRRITCEPAKVKGAIKCSEDVVDLFMGKMRRYKKEHLIGLLLNPKGEIIEEVVISIGDISSSVSHPREVFAQAVRRCAGSIILVHNHPSGDPTPSGDDIETTERLIEVGRLLGIHVIDHVIIGDGTSVSMVSEGYVSTDC